ncbi:unnamed protein product [Amoebophrya sp. A25]|nr:unnamed protein product [Amoebophrya sp. A25]|eukprot:GSA25T00005625001.1
MYGSLGSGVENALVADDVDNALDAEDVEKALESALSSSEVDSAPGSDVEIIVVDSSDIESQAFKKMSDSGSLSGSDSVLRTQGQMLGRVFAIALYKRRVKYTILGIPEEKHLMCDIVLAVVLAYFIFPVMTALIWWVVFVLVALVVGTAGAAVYSPDKFQEIRAQAQGYVSHVPTEDVVGAFANLKTGFGEGVEVGRRTSVRLSQPGE